jgi:phosphoribosylamine--glycine ligase
MVFHAGTTKTGDKVVTSGGRVLAVSARGDTMRKALNSSYHDAGLLKFEGVYYRADIGFDL